MTLANSQLREYLNFLIVERGLSQNTISSYSRDLERFIVAADVADFTLVAPLDVESHISRLRANGLAESSIARAVVSIRNLVEFACKEQKSLNLIKDVKPPRVKGRLPKALSIAEVSDLIAATHSPSNPRALRETAIVELLYGTGARISEIVSLNVSDVMKIDGGEVANLRLTGKGSKVRVVPLGTFARAALDQYLIRIRPALVTKDREALFLNDRGGRLSRQSMWTIVSEAAKRANIATEVSPHSLRHSYATHLLDGGADVRVVQELLGHSSVTTTQIYTLVTIDKLRENYSNAHPRAKSK
ncbi:MAG: site-specific tyrosine recombinase XerD [Actinomycetes bacterium]|jgi:integrase/recombinase XerD